MKKMLTIIVALCLAASFAVAAMDDVSVTTSSLTTGTAYTNTFTARGTLERVYVTCSSWLSGTNTITITSDGQTLFAKALTANSCYYPKIALHGTNGAAITFLSGSNSDNLTNTWYGPLPVGGTVTIVQAHTGSGSTNAYTCKLLINK